MKNDITSWENTKPFMTESGFSSKNVLLVEGIFVNLLTPLI